MSQATHHRLNCIEIIKFKEMLLMRLTIIIVVQLLILNQNWVTGAECSDGEYAPDPFDCNAFFQCQFGMWLRRNCPRDLHFNRFNFVCDFSWNANCAIDATSTTTTTTTPDDPGTSTLLPTPSVTPTESPTHSPTDTPLPTVTEPTFPPTTSTTPLPPTDSPTPTTDTPLPTVTDPTFPPTSPLPTIPPHLECPHVDGAFPVHLPHPNCTMFYKCVHGIPHEMLCPFTQHWAMFLDRCELAFEANCVEGAAREQPNARPPNYW